MSIRTRCREQESPVRHKPLRPGAQIEGVNPGYLEEHRDGTNTQLCADVGNQYLYRGYRKRQKPTPKLPQSHLMIPSSTHPCHQRFISTIFSCLTRPAYSRSTRSFSVSSPPKKATSSENSARRECVCLKLPDNWADCAAYAPNEGVNARTVREHRPCQHSFTRAPWTTYAVQQRIEQEWSIGQDLPRQHSAIAGNYTE